MKGKTGQVLVETAIILPLLIMMLLGIVDFGRAMHSKNGLNIAARAGARAAAVATSPLNLPESATSLSFPKTPLQTQVKMSLPDDVPADKVTYMLERVDQLGNTTPGTTQNGDEVRVTLSWKNFPMILPYALNLEGTASMRYEGRP